mgnify:CR=1 FL=1
MCNLEDDTMSKQTERDAFRSRWGFILACIGSAVGMGNIWRFPYLVSAWGGMTFLLPYFLFVLLIGSTGIIGEMALGRSTRSGPIGAFGQAAALRGRRSTGEAVGYIPVLGSLALAIGYSCVVGWIFRYFALALDGGLFAMGQDMNVIVDRFNGTACGWGNNFWLVIALAVNFAIMAFGVGGGIERANKVMMPVLFFLFAGLGVYIATLPGAGDGYRYIFTLDPVGLADPKLWIYAFGQAFFSLSVAGNGTVIYGSYFSDDESIPSAARNVALFDTLAALLAALVIIPAMAAGGADLSDGGPGLMFIFLVNAKIPSSRVTFFVALYICFDFIAPKRLVGFRQVAFVANPASVPKHPSTNTTTLYFGKTKSGCPTNLELRRHPVIPYSRNNATNLSPVLLFPFERVLDIISERFFFDTVSIFYNII